MSWFSQNEDFFHEETQKQADKAKNSNNIKNWRFRLKKGQTGHIVFLSDLEFFIKEHQYQANGSYYNYETCIEGIHGECPLCDNDCNCSPVAIATVIDLTEHQRKDGSTTGPQRKPIVLKKGGAERFLKRQKKLEGLKGKKFEVSRSSDQKGEATGTDVEYDKEADLTKLKEFAPEGWDKDEWIQPLELSEIFAPKTPEELRKAIGAPDPIGSAEKEISGEPEKEEGGKSLADLV